MGVVYLAQDEATGERAALKVMTSDTQAGATRFRREAEAVARVTHPGICRVLEVGPEGERLWIALEYVEGETLAAALRRERRVREDAAATGTVAERAPDRWLELGERVAQALHAAHEAGLVHRDIKPANIMLATDGRVVVLDFGLAHADASGEQTQLTQTGVPVGTPAYMSPEQVHAGLVRVDRRTDVYSLGATLYEAFTLEPPFSGPTVASLFSQILTAAPEPARRKNPALSRDLEVVLATALEKRPARRYATARHMAEDLARVRRGERVRARPAGPLRRFGAWAVRHPGLAAAFGSVVLALATGLLVALSMVSTVSKARDREAASARHARSRALAAASSASQRSDAMLSLLLAREALRTERSPETITQLHTAVHGSLERALLTGHGGPVTSVAWDRAGRRIATGSTDGRARLYDLPGTLRVVVPAAGVPSAGEVDVTLSPSGTRLATRTTQGAATLWADDGREIAPLTAEDVPTLLAVEFLEDDSVVAVGSRRIAIHEPDGARRVAWDIPSESAEGVRLVVSVELTAGPPRIHVWTGDRRAITYDDRGAEVARREQAMGTKTSRLFAGARLAWLEPGDGNDPNSETMQVLARDGSTSGWLRGAFPEESMLTGGDTWWATWSPFGGIQVVHEVGVLKGTVVGLDTQRSERPARLAASPEGGRLFSQRRTTDLIVEARPRPSRCGCGRRRDTRSRR